MSLLCLNFFFIFFLKVFVFIKEKIREIEGLDMKENM